MGREKIVILKKDLYRLYHKENKSILRIAKIYHCNWETVRRRLHKFGIPVKPGRITIPRKDLYRFYHEQHKSTFKIAKIYNCTPSAISYKLRKLGIPLKSPSQARIRYLRHDFSGDLAEKAYLIGFRIGDLRVFKTKPYAETVVVQGHTTMIEQVVLMKALFKKYGQVTITFCKDGTIDANCYLNMTFHFLLPKTDYIEPWILKNNDSFAAFVAGYIDAEGSFGINQGRARFKVDSYDKNILHKIHLWCHKQDIISKLRLIGKKGQLKLDGYYYNSDLWRLNINKYESLLKFMSKIKSFVQHEKRIRDMQKCLNELKTRRKRRELKMFHNILEKLGEKRDL